MTRPVDKYDQPYERGRLRTVARMLPSGPGRALDVGCGSGAVSMLVHDRGFDVTGVDFDIHALGLARQQVPSGVFVHADLPDGPLPDGPFELITACEILEHFELDEQHRLLTRLVERIRPGGRLILSTPNTASLMSAVGAVIYPLQGRHWDCGDSTHRHVHNAWSLRRTLARAGLDVETQRGFQLLTHRPRRLARLGMNEFRGALSWVCYDLIVEAIRL